MAEYYAVLSKAVAGLDSNTDESRRAVYDKARNALIGQLKAIDPPLPTAEISRQRLELEEAIRRVERETVGAPSTTARVPAARAPRQPAPAPHTPPQDIFRRAMEEPEAEEEPAPRVERVNGRRDFSWDEEVDYEAPAPASARQDYYDEPQDADEPRLVPNYDYEWDPNAPPQPAPPRMDEPRVEARQSGRDRGQERERAPNRQRRARRSQGDENAYVARRARPSRLPVILLLVLIVAMAGGLAALAWSQRDMIADLMQSFGSGSSSQTAEAPAQPAAPTVDTSGKDNARLLDGSSGAAGAGVRDVTTPSGSDTASGPAETPVAQRAALYEEPANGSDSSAGVLAFNASVVWRFANDPGQEPEIDADIRVPDRNLVVRLHMRRNTDQTLPASHVIEVVTETGPKFAGGGIREVPRMVLKPAEDARGQPLVGASAKVSDGLFWIALSGVEADVQTNLSLLRDRSWIDLPLVYDNGQRAILTFEKGTPGARVFEKALALWGG